MIILNMTHSWKQSTNSSTTFVARDPNTEDVEHLKLGIHMYFGRAALSTSGINKLLAHDRNGSDS